MRIPRIVQFRRSVFSRWSFRKETILLATCWIALGIYRLISLFSVSSATISHGPKIPEILLLAWTFSYGLGGWPWRKNKKEVEVVEPKSQDFSWITREDDEFQGDIMKSDGWEDTINQVDLKASPWLAEEYEPEVQVLPDKSQLKGPLRDDP